METKMILVQRLTGAAELAVASGMEILRTTYGIGPRNDIGYNYSILSRKKAETSKNKDDQSAVAVTQTGICFQKISEFNNQNLGNDGFRIKCDLLTEATKSANPMMKLAAKLSNSETESLSSNEYLLTLNDKEISTIFQNNQFADACRIIAKQNVAVNDELKYIVSKTPEENLSPRKNLTVGFIHRVIRYLYWGLVDIDKINQVRTEIDIISNSIKKLGLACEKVLGILNQGND